MTDVKFSNITFKDIANKKLVIKTTPYLKSATGLLAEDYLTIE